jgi:hypothetical protein
MTPKEKVEQLVVKFLKHSRAEKDITPIQSAKQCALIAVDEIILTTFKKESWDKWNIIPQIESTTEYWKEVKKEIEKL